MADRIFEEHGITVVSASNGRGQGRRLEIHACDVSLYDPEDALELGTAIVKWAEEEARRRKTNG